MNDIDRLIRFVGFTNKFREIERVIFAKGTVRQENDSEHSFQLAMAAWYIIDSKHLPLDIAKTLRYALAHDLVEIYAGDTAVFDKDQSLHSSKAEREEKAALRIRDELPEFPELHALIIAYESKADPESIFVFALDKILPIITIYLDGGKGWHEWEVSFTALYENKASKVSLSPEIKKYFDELMAIIKKEEGSLFPSAQQSIP